MTAEVTRPIAAKRRSNGNGHTTFVCSLMPEAAQVCLVGDFNSWNPEATPMTRRGGKFEVKLALTPGEYEYKFVVDGQWVADPTAALRRRNPFGSDNSVVRV